MAAVTRPTPAETRAAGTDVQPERTGAGIPLLVACLMAPLTAVSKRWPNVLHAADMDTIITAWPNGTVTAACGKNRLRVLGWGRGDDRQAVPWPPRVDSLPTGWSRCRDCHTATGRKRPRSRWVPAS